MKLKQQVMEESTYMSFDSLDIDSITLPRVSSSRTLSEHEGSNSNNEILLDSVARSANLPINPYCRVNCNGVNEKHDRSSEVTRGLQRGRLTSSERSKLLQRFNIDDDMMSSSDFGGARTSQSSASESTGRADSLEGSPIPISSDTRRSRLRSSSSQLQSFGNNKKGIISPQSQTKNFQNSPSEKPLKDDKSSDVFSITTVSSPRNARKDIKAGKRSQGLPHQQRQGRDQGVSASARRIFSSLRKTGRGRSSSRERTEKSSPTKIGNEAKVHDDLSSDANLPGILKIFGDAVSPGAKYKSVLATRQSKARELVKAALERYGIPRSMARKFVLCEVVGRIREEDAETSTAKPVEETFVEDYVRPLNDHEKPLILQSYWKPLEGYARRFELRDRSQVLDQITTEKDRETKDVNAQAKRLIIKNARLSRTQSSMSLKMLLPDSSDSDEDEETERKSNTMPEQKVSSDRNHNNLQNSSAPTPPQFADEDKFTAGHSKRAAVPFLLTLQGEDSIQSDSSKESGGSLVHVLDTKVTVIGRDRAPSLSEGRGKAAGSSKDINIKLSGDDIRTHHCVVYRVPADEDGSGPHCSPWKVTLHLVDDDCNVTVNGQAIASDEELNNGDIITIGSKYIFMFKDPASKDKLNSNLRLTGMAVNSSRLGGIASKGSAFTPVKKRCVEMEINYRHEHEDSVLEVIFAAANDIVSTSSSRIRPVNCDRELAPARFIIHCIEQSCINFTLEQKKNLLFMIARNLQTILLDATDSVSRQDDNKIKNPEEGINYILPKLEDVVFWMSNTLEIFSYLQNDITDRVNARVAKEMELNEVDANLLHEASSFRVRDDVLAILEEIVMYAFQQLVYYLTKTLYGALPRVLDANPFAEASEDSESSSQGIGLVITIYEAALGLTRKYGVHPTIESQLFAYLFFFTNVSLFNTLMEEGAVNKYYRWDKGVQIRGNLEEIECWANDNGFQEQAIMFLEKISALTNLLATTKTQMLQSTWDHFRRDFPSLTPTQLRHVLNGYILGPRVKKRPPQWTPDAKDFSDSTEEESLLESYDNHPPLVLPMDGTRIELDVIPQEAWYTAIRDTVIAVGRGHKFESTSSPDVWLANSDLEGSDVGDRQQYDDHGIPLHHQHTHSPISTSSNSSVPSRHSRKTPPRQDKSYIHPESNYVSAKLNGRTNSPSSTSVSSILSDSNSQASFTTEKTMVSPSKHAVHEVKSPRPAVRKTAGIHPTPSPRSTKSKSENNPLSPAAANSRPTTKYATLDRPKKKTKHRQPIRSLTDDQVCDYKSLTCPEAVIEGVEETSELRVLPISTTLMKHSEIETQRSGAHNSAGKSDSQLSMPSEVFIVDVVKGRKGLGLGLVDGMHTSLRVPGVFVRSIVPDGPSVKHVRMKHQEVIKCWLQDGRLLLGDRILAVNGTSLVSMNYSSAMDELRQAGDRMRFLVGRSSADVAMKITSSSC